MVFLIYTTGGALDLSASHTTIPSTLLDTSIHVDLSAVVPCLPDAIFDSSSRLRTSTLSNWQLQAVQVLPSSPETIEVIATIAHTE